MTAAEQCRLATGLTLAEAARRIGKSRQALYDWHRDSPERFTAALKEAKGGQVERSVCSHPEAARKSYHDESVVCGECNCVIEQKLNREV
jgi:hypothetical protein